MNVTGRGRLRSPVKAAAVLSLVALSSACSSGASSFGKSGGASQLDASNGGIKRHVYAAIGVGASRLEPDASDRSDFTVNDRVEPAGQVTLGLDVTRHLSIEGHAADLGSAGFSPGGRINYHVNGASALLYVGKNRGNFKRQGLSGYGRLGVGVLDGSPVGPVPFETVNGTHMLLGAGVEYMTSIGLGLRLEGISYDEDIQYGQLGLMYRTGRRGESRPVEIVQNVAEPVVEPIVESAPQAAAAQIQPAYDCNAISQTLDTVTFRTDSAELTDSALQSLDQVALQLSYCDSVPVRVSAHTDSRGSKSYNDTLSYNRANAVTNYLSQNGVSSERLTAEALGESQPIDTNGTAEGRQRNRRVELISIQ